MLSKLTLFRNAYIDSMSAHIQKQFPGMKGLHEETMYFPTRCRHDYYNAHKHWVFVLPNIAFRLLLEICRAIGVMSESLDLPRFLRLKYMLLHHHYTIFST